MKVLCDTNIISELMRPLPDLKVKNWISVFDQIYLSVISVEEIYFGLSAKNASRQIHWFEKFVYFRCEVIPVNHSIAKICGVLRGKFRKQGITRTQADLLIAATALEYNLIVATRNIRDFTDTNVQLVNPFES